MDQPEIYAEATDNDDFLKDQSTHFNLQAVRATLARVYMTYEKTDSAYYYADKVIRESGLSLVDKTEVANDIIGTLSMKETIFGLYSQTTLYNSSKAYLYESTSYKSLASKGEISRVLTSKTEEEMISVGRLGLRQEVINSVLLS